MYQLTTSIAAAGYALEGESDYAKTFIDLANNQYKDAIEMLNNVFVDGEWPEGMDYNRHVAYPLLKYFEIVKSATGRDLYQECDWLHKNAYFVLYTTRPDDTFYRFSDNDFPKVTDWERRYLVRVASYYKDPYIQWYVNHKTQPHDYAPRNIYDVLWYDSGLPEKSPDDLPKAKLFKSMGVVIARSGWDKDSTWLSFKCGNYYGDHIHLDNSSFTIYKLGDLAIDSGLYGDDFGSSHWVNYFSRTIAHNSILVYDPRERFSGYEGMPVSNDGGQKIMLWQRGDRAVPENYSKPDPILPWTWVKNKDLWQIGNIKDFKLTDEYCYIAADATKSYSAQKLEKFIRQILFIFPDYFIITDQVSSTNPDFKKTWLLHTINEPKITNDEILNLDGYGKLYCKVLYPAKVSLNKIGGQGKEFLVDGINYPHNDEIYPGNIPGSWRIEVQPQIPQKEDIFLNFLSTSKIDEQKTPNIQRIESDNVLGVALEFEDPAWLVIFNPKDSDPVTYSIKKIGKVRNLIFNLKPDGKYEIIQNKVTFQILSADKDGILDFKLDNIGESILEIKLIS